MRMDLDLYERHADDWWDDRSPSFRSLHRVNRFRFALLREWVDGGIEGATIVDLGCGGGLLAEPLARAGARRVIGVDLGPRSVAAARDHARAEQAIARDRGGVVPDYLRGDVRRAPLRSRCADGVLLADVLEHVGDWPAAIREAARLLRPGGWLYVNTLNRTLAARLLAITVAEGLGFVPRGTHDARLFVAPDALVATARAAGLVLQELQGERPLLLATLKARAIELRRSRRLDVLYSAMFRREASGSV